MRKGQHSELSFPLVWRRRFEWRGPKVISRGFLLTITVSENAIYITFTDNQEAIKILRIQFYEPSLSQSNLDSLAQSNHSVVGNQVRSVSLAKMYVHIPFNLQDYAAQYFPQRGKGNHAYVYVREVSESGESMPSKVCLRQTKEQDWFYMEKENTEIPELFSTSFDISVYTGTTSTYYLSPERFTCGKLTEFHGKQDLIVPHKLCSVCEEICRNSHLLKDSLFWTTKSANEFYDKDGNRDEDQNQAWPHEDEALRVL